MMRVNRVQPKSQKGAFLRYFGREVYIIGLVNLKLVTCVIEVLLLLRIRCKTSGLRLISLKRPKNYDPYVNTVLEVKNREIRKKIGFVNTIEGTATANYSSLTFVLTRLMSFSFFVNSDSIYWNDNLRLR